MDEVINNQQSTTQAAQPVQQVQPAQSSSVSTQQPAKKSSKLKFFTIFAVVLLIIAAVLSYIFPRIQPQPQPADDVIATVGNQIILRSDIQKATAAQYAPNAINAEVLKRFRNILIERKILDLEAKKLGISVGPLELNTKLSGMVSNANTTITKSMRDSAYYDLLKQKVTSKVVDSRTALIVSYWTPSSSYDLNELTSAQKLRAQKQQQEALSALPEILTLMKNGEEPLPATKKIMVKLQYLELAKILAVNGYIISETKDEAKLSTPRAYTINDRNSIGKILYDALVSLKKGDIKLVFGKENASGWIIKMTDSTDSSFKTYNEWLKDRVKKIVMLHESI